MLDTAIPPPLVVPTPSRAERRRLARARRTDAQIRQTSLTATGLLAVAAVVVPLLYSSGWDDAFTVIKLGALWGVLGVALVVAFVLVAIYGSLDLRFRGHPVVNTALAVWIGWNVLAFVLSTDRKQSLVGEHYWYQGLLTMLLYAGFFLLARAVLTRPPWMWIVAAAVATGGVIVGLVGWMQTLGADPVFGIAAPEGRIFSTIGQSNSLGSYLVVTTVIAAAFLARPERTVRVAGALAMLVMIGALVLTASRGGYAGLVVAGVVGCACLVWASGTPWTRVLVVGLAALAVLAVLVASIGPVRAGVDDAWTRTVGGTGNTRDPSNRIHTVLWHEAWRISLDHPLVGTGQETFPDVVPPYLADQSQQVQFGLSPFRLESPHDVYLAITTGAGFPALAAYLTFVVAVVVLLLRGARRAASPATRALLVAVVAVVAGHLVTDAFMTADLSATWLTWLLMGGALAIATSPAALGERTEPIVLIPDPDAARDRGPWDLLPAHPARRIGATAVHE
jgi:O-antigen ligase